MVKGVIFDMDGTMFDTERLLTVAWDKAAKKMGVVISPELMEACRGKSPEAIGKLLKAEFGEQRVSEIIENRKAVEVPVMDSIHRKGKEVSL